MRLRRISARRQERDLWLPIGDLRSAINPISTLAAAATILLLTACSPPPPIVSADTSCERFAHISATDAQIAVLANEEFWGTYTDQIVAHNIEYDKSCLGPVKP